MSDCKHKVILYETLEKSSKYSIVVRKWFVGGLCPDCHHDLNDEEVFGALKRTYAPEIENLVKECYEHKRAYYQASSELSANGVMCALLPPESIERPL